MPMSPAEAVTWGSFVQAAYDQYASDPGQANPAAIMNMPAGYTLVRTIQMTDFLGPVRSRVFYGFVAAGGDPRTAVVALRGTVGAAEWWDDLHWDLVPFTPVTDGGKVARGFSDIYSTYGTARRHRPPSPPTWRTRPPAAFKRALIPRCRRWCAATAWAARWRRCWSRTWPRTRC